MLTLKKQFKIFFRMIPIITIGIMSGIILGYLFGSLIEYIANAKFFGDGQYFGMAFGAIISSIFSALIGIKEK